MDGDAPLVVVGHKNPDTDSICSAIAYARLKERQGIAAVPYRAGNINTQTRYVLDRFGCPVPELLTSLRPTLADIMIPKDQLFVLAPDDPLSRAMRIILDNSFSFLPVADDSGRSLGKITVLRLTRLLDELSRRGAKDGEPLPPVTSAIAEALARPISEYVEAPEALFYAGDFVRDVERQINQYNVGGFVVTDEAKRIAGVITRVNFLSRARHRVALVDHNEVSQAVDGVEDAEVIEIVDHHRIGAPTTTMPISFTNRVVGSTATIVAEMFWNSGLEPDEQTAALLLSAMLSDTVILKSPTTTKVDREVATRLSKVARLDLEHYGEEMFAAGSAVGSLTAREIVEQDQKLYDEAGFHFAVSQVEMVGFKLFEERAGEIATAVEETRGVHDLDFACLMVTDITEETTRLVFAGPQRFSAALHYPVAAPVSGGTVFEMRHVVSRKKQVLPYLIDVLREL